MVTQKIFGIPVDVLLADSANAVVNVGSFSSPTACVIALRDGNAGRSYERISAAIIMIMLHPKSKLMMIIVARSEIQIQLVESFTDSQVEHELYILPTPSSWQLFELRNFLPTANQKTSNSPNERACFFLSEKVSYRQTNISNFTITTKGRNYGRKRNHHRIIS